MSLFDNLVVSYKNHTKQEWESIIYKELMLVFKEHWLDRFWCSNLDDATEYISPAYKNEKKFKKHLHQYRRLPRHIKDCFDIVFKKIWDEYGVMFTYEIEKNPKIKRIKKITFKNVA